MGASFSLYTVYHLALTMCTVCTVITTTPPQSIPTTPHPLAQQVHQSPCDGIPTGVIIAGPSLTIGFPATNPVVRRYEVHTSLSHLCAHQALHLWCLIFVSLFCVDTNVVMVLLIFVIDICLWCVPVASRCRQALPRKEMVEQGLEEGCCWTRSLTRQTCTLQTATRIKVCSGHQ